MNQPTPKKSIEVRTSGILEPPPDLLAAFDPGLGTGVALFEKGNLTKVENVYGIVELTHFVEALPRPDLIVMEKYRLFKWLALQQSGSKMEVAQAEGVILSWATRNKIKVVEQGPQVLFIARMWTKIDERQGQHSKMHWKSAYNHGMYYLILNNMAEEKR